METKRVVLSGGPFEGSRVPLDVHVAAVGYGWKGGKLIVALRRADESPEAAVARVSAAHSVPIVRFIAEAAMVHARAVACVPVGHEGYDVYEFEGR